MVEFTELMVDMLGYFDLYQWVTVFWLQKSKKNFGKIKLGDFDSAVRGFW